MIDAKAGNGGYAPTMEIEAIDPPPFGACAPNRFQRAVIGFTRRRKETWLGKRLSFIARRLVLTGLKRPLDVESYGLPLRLHPTDNLCEKRILFTPQFFDRAERAFLAERLGPGSVFIDIGANVGIYALLAARAGARVLAIEPQPVVFARLAFNIAAAGLGERVTAVEGALADREGRLEIVIDERNLGHSGADTEGARRITVSCRPLLALMDAHGIARADAMKIDVEGAEDVILTAFFRDAPPGRHPGAIILENAPARWAIDCVALCEDQGYRVAETTHMNVILAR